jgi:hypothetical protein
MSVSHVHFREGQILRAADLRAEQHDRLQGWEQHIRSLHGWGIAHGLRIEEDASCLPAGVRLIVEPGLAIDRWGRSLMLGAAQHFSYEQVSDAACGARCVCVWLAPWVVSVPCTPRAPARERFEACIILTPSPGPGCPMPPEPGDLEAPAPGPPKPVYLGRWCDDYSVDCPCHAPGYAPDPDVAYVGPKGSWVRAPNRAIEMQLGREGLDDFTRFAIRTFHPQEPATDGGATGDAIASPVAIDRLTINAAGRITLRGPVAIVLPEPAGATPAPIAYASAIANDCCDPCRTLENCKEPADKETDSAEEPPSASVETTVDLIIDNACATRPRGVRFAPAISLPTQARPWRIYHTKVEESDEPGDRFRVELQDLGGRGNPDAIKLAIGHSSDACVADNCGCDDDSKPENGCCFTECLAITADCALRIPQCYCLVVQGRIRESPIQPDPNDSRFTAAQMAVMLQALFNAFLLTVPSSEAVPLLASLTTNGAATGRAPGERNGTDA